MSWPPRPVIYEVNAWVWLQDLSKRWGRGVQLDSVPDAEWDALAGRDLDAVWLMGVWERSPAGRAIAFERQDLRAEYSRALPDWQADDVAGSPYCIHAYSVDPHLGGPAGLAAARGALSRRGLRLLVDFVPNHTAPDHAWVLAHPERFINGTMEDLQRDPQSFFRTGGHVIACGHDPYFPAWTDTAQVNAFHPEYRRAAVDTLRGIAGQADGVRCDMAMLLINSIFERTWGPRAGSPPGGEFWREVIPAVKETDPDFLFIAEAYWDLEWELQQQGFDYCYDKRLYDRLAHESPASLRAHLRAGHDYQDRLMRFIENHDEPRAEAAFGPQRHRTTAAAILTLPGAVLLHEGQSEGRRVKLPVQLGRRPAEAPDMDLQRFYDALLPASHRETLRNGEWALCETTGWPDNASHGNLLAWCWRGVSDRQLVVLNYSDAPAQGRIQIPWAELDGREWDLRDAWTGAVFRRGGTELQNEGLFVDLPPWGGHVLTF